MRTVPEVLLVEDDQAVRRSLQLLLRGHGYRVKAYPSSQAVSDDPDAVGAALLLADYRLPGANGFDVLRRLREAGFGGSAILMTGFGSEALSRQAEALGFDLVLDKPIRPNQLLTIARAATRPR